MRGANAPRVVANVTSLLVRGLPFSRSVAVILLLLPPTRMVAGSAVRVKLYLSQLMVSSAEAPRLSALSLTLALPVRVNVPIAFPSAPAVHGIAEGFKVPAPSITVIVTGDPGKGLLSSSRTVTVMSAVPFVGKLEGSATIVSIMPVGVKSTEIDCDTEPDVAVTVDRPGVVADLSETTTVPVASGVITLVADSVPRDALNLIRVPAGTGRSAASSTLAVMVDELIPSATMLGGSAVSVIDAASEGLVN